MHPLPTEEKKSSVLLTLLVWMFLLAGIVLLPGIVASLVIGYHKTTTPLLLVSRLLIWLFFIVMFIYTVRVKRERFLWWDEKKYNLLFYIAAVLIILVVIFFGIGIISLTLMKMGFNNSSNRIKDFMEIFRNNKFLMVFTALTAGIVEEFVFRGYVQPRLEYILKSPVLAILVSSLYFGLLHIGYGTVAQVIAPFYISFILGLFYSNYRNLKVVVICHFLWDLLALLVALNAHKLLK